MFLPSVTPEPPHTSTIATNSRSVEYIRIIKLITKVWKEDSIGIILIND